MIIIQATILGNCYQFMRRKHIWPVYKLQLFQARTGSQDREIHYKSITLIKRYIGEVTCDCSIFFQPFLTIKL